jgi:hypothetical protein
MLAMRHLQRPFRTEMQSVPWSAAGGYDREHSAQVGSGDFEYHRHARALDLPRMPDGERCARCELRQMPDAKTGLHRLEG